MTPDQCVRGAALAPLASEDRQYLAALGRLAWEKAGSPGNYNDWRHRRCLQVVERRGLTDCRVEDYLPLKGDFLAIIAAADPNAKRGARLAGRARGLRERTATDDRRRALWRLQKECEAAADAIPNADRYVAAIALRKHGSPDMGELSPKQIWSLIFTLRSRAQKRRKAWGSAGVSECGSEVPF